MPKIQRETQKIFCNSADSDQIAVFGSMATGTPVYSNNIEELQNNEAFDLGWDAATLEDKAPFMEEMNGMQYGITKQLAYNFQEGVPEYDAGTTYYIGSIVKVLEENKPVLYTSLTDENLGNNPVTDATNWERLSFGGGGLEIGDIGIAPLGIDETQGKRRYLNGQLIIQDQYVEFTNKVKSAVALYPSLACTESEWQTTATMTVGGQVGKFVVDNEAGTIRLPKIIMPIQGLTDLSKLAEIVQAGLPNITGDIYRDSNTSNLVSAWGEMGPENTVNTGALYMSDAKKRYSIPEATQATTYQYYNRLNIDASKSNPIYGNSNTVQQEQIQYPYFIQVATGAEVEDNIINEIELNNPFSLLDYKYSEYELNNLSWLRSNGQYNSKAVYPAVYDLLLKIYNGTETKAGVSVKLSTETFTDYEFVLNTAEETFRLPIKVKQTFLNAINGNMPVVGNGIALGLTNGTKDFGISCNYTPTGSSSAILTGSNGYGTTIGSSTTGYPNSGVVNTSFGLTTDPTKSGIVAQVSQSEISGLYLYFYVGETVQNANLINAGRIEEKIVDIASELPHKLNDKQITNCLLEVPQRIKLELNNGVLTLKAGSVVIVPNGFEADGTTKKFDYVTVESDSSITNADNITTFVFYQNGTITLGNIVVSESGATPPSTAFYYNTITNKVSFYLDGVIIWDNGSLPVAIAKSDSNSIVSIDQVFNGIGYIGSTVWVDKGVKGLIPNGRNEDGTLNNIEAQNNALDTITYTNDIKGVYFGFDMYGNPQLNGAYSYDEKDNYVYNGENKVPVIYCGTYDVVGGKVANFQPKQPFRAVDYNEVTSLCVPDYSAGVSLTNGFVAPCAGFVYLHGGNSNTTSGYFYVNGVEVGRQTHGAAGASGSSMYALVGTSDVITWGGDFGWLNAYGYFFPMKGAR